MRAMNNQEKVTLHSLDEVVKVVAASYPHKENSKTTMFIYLVAMGIFSQVAYVKKEDLPAAVLKELQLLVAAGKE